MDITNALRARGVGVGKKLVGDAATTDVRAGKTFSNATGNDKVGTLAVQTGGNVVPTASDIVKPAGIYDAAITVKGVAVPADKVLVGNTIAGTPGTMVDNTGSSTESVPHPTAGRLDIEIPVSAFYRAGDWALRLTDPEFIAANILNNANIFGLQGTAQAAIYAMAATPKSTTSTAAVSLKSVTVNVSGTMRISFDLMTNIGSQGASAKIYKNGVAVGLQRTADVASQWYTYTEDIAANAGDIFEIYVWALTAGGQACYVRNFEIKNSIGSPYNAVVNVN